MPVRVTCKRCRWQGEPDSDVQDAVLAAHRALQHLDLRQRQLSASERILVLAPGQDQRLLAWWLATGVPLLVAFLIGLAALLDALGRDDGVYTILDRRVVLVTVLPATWSPFVLFVVLGVTLRRTLAQRAGDLSRALWARPSARGGEGLSCRCCGAPLEARASSKVVRCVHCASDNVLPREASLDAMAAELRAFADQQTAVAESAFARRRPLKRQILTALVAPLALLAVAIPAAVLAHHVLERRRGAVNEEVRYVRIAPLAGDRSACIGYRDTTSDGERVVTRGDLAPCNACRVVAGGSDPARGTVDEAMLSPVRAADLVGRSVTVDGDYDHRTWRVEQAFADGFARNRLVVHAATAPQGAAFFLQASVPDRVIAPEQACLIEAPAPSRSPSSEGL